MFGMFVNRYKTLITIIIVVLFVWFLYWLLFGNGKKVKNKSGYIGPRRLVTADDEYFEEVLLMDLEEIKFPLLNDEGCKFVLNQDGLRPNIDYVFNILFKNIKIIEALDDPLTYLQSLLIPNFNVDHDAENTPTILKLITPDVLKDKLGAKTTSINPFTIIEESQDHTFTQELKKSWKVLNDVLESDKFIDFSTGLGQLNRRTCRLSDKEIIDLVKGDKMKIPFNDKFEETKMSCGRAEEGKEDDFAFYHKAESLVLQNAKLIKFAEPSKRGNKTFNSETTGIYEKISEQINKEVEDFRVPSFDEAKTEYNAFRAEDFTIYNTKEKIGLLVGMIIIHEAARKYDREFDVTPKYLSEKKKKFADVYRMSFVTTCLSRDPNVIDIDDRKEVSEIHEFPICNENAKIKRKKSLIAKKKVDASQRIAISDEGDRMPPDVLAETIKNKLNPKRKIKGGSFALSEIKKIGIFTGKDFKWLIEGLKEYSRSWFTKDRSALRPLFYTYFNKNEEIWMHEEPIILDEGKDDPIADIYPAEKLALFVIYVSLYLAHTQKSISLRNLKIGLGTYILIAHIINSCCACVMNESWNEAISNEYVYFYENNGQKDPDIRFDYNSYLERMANYANEEAQDAVLRGILRSKLECTEDELTREFYESLLPDGPGSEIPIAEQKFMRILFVSDKTGCLVSKFGFTEGPQYNIKWRNKINFGVLEEEDGDDEGEICGWYLYYKPGKDKCPNKKEFGDIKGFLATLYSFTADFDTMIPRLTQGTFFDDEDVKCRRSVLFTKSYTFWSDCEVIFLNIALSSSAPPTINDYLHRINK